MVTIRVEGEKQMINQSKMVIVYHKKYDAITARINGVMIEFKSWYEVIDRIDERLKVIIVII